MKKELNLILGIALAVLLIFNVSLTYKSLNQAKRVEMVVESELSNLRNRLSVIESRINTSNYTSNNTNAEQEVMTATDLTNYLKMDIQELFRILEDPKSNIPFVKVDGTYRFSKKAIDEWLKSRTEINP